MSKPGPEGSQTGSDRADRAPRTTRRRLVPHANVVRTAYLSDLEHEERAALRSWLGFSTTFAGVRGITHAIRAGWGPFGNIGMGGRHLHHYLWGIGALAGVGAVAVRGQDETRRHPAVALSYGAGMALIVDEFALLLDLKDVYWAQEGRVSVDLGIGVVTAGGTALALRPLWRKVREREQEGHGRGNDEARSARPDLTTFGGDAVR